MVVESLSARIEMGMWGSKRAPEMLPRWIQADGCGTWILLLEFHWSGNADVDATVLTR